MLSLLKKLWNWLKSLFIASPKAINPKKVKQRLIYQGKTSTTPIWFPQGDDHLAWYNRGVALGNLSRWGAKRLGMK